MRVLLGGLVLSMAGCGPNSEHYVAEYVDLQCAFALECYDEAVLEFYGWDSQETCVSDFGAQVATAVEGCATYDKAAAKQCLKEMEALQCPAEGEDPTFPLICDTVYGDCEAADTDDSDSSSDDTDGA